MPLLLTLALSGLLARAPSPPPPQVLPPLPTAPAAAPLPLPPLAEPGEHPRSEALIQLEAAIRQRLFQGPLTTSAPDPDSTEWQQARAQGQRPDCREVGPLRYLNAEADLDGDGRNEQLVAVLGSYACGSRGCTLLVFRRAEAGGWDTLAELDLFQAPLWLSEDRQAGWRQLLMPATDGVSQPVRLAWQPLLARYGVVPPAAAVAAATTLTPLLELEPLPFEQLGRPLSCAGAP